MSLMSLLLRRLQRPTATPAKSGPEVFTGNYATWQAAAAECSGYDAGNIFEKTSEAALAVRDGKAVFERDSVLFFHHEFRWEIIAPMLWQAACDGGRLSVLDFGGALGSLYFQSRSLLDALPEMRWSVVEQPRHVEFGERELTVGGLRFYRTIEECLEAEQPNVLLLSSVLPYLPAPYDFLRSVIDLGFPTMIVDRTALIEGADRLTIQRVTPEIYDASYPAWFLSRDRVQQMIEASGYIRQAEWDADRLPLDGKTLTFKGAFYAKAGSSH